MVKQFEQAPAQQTPDERNRQNAPSGLLHQSPLSLADADSGLTRGQQNILNMQRTSGNAAVRNAIQRDPPASPSLLQMRQPPPVPNLFGNPFAGMDQATIDSIIGPPRPGAGPGSSASSTTTGSDAGSAVSGQITMNFNATRASLTTETETTGDLGHGAEVSHTGSAEGHEFSVSMTGTLGGRSSPELSSEATIHLDPTGTRVTSLEVRGGAEWTRNYLNNMLRVQSFLRMLVQAEAPEAESSTVSASAALTLTPTARATAGTSARLTIGNTRFTLGGTLAVEAPSMELTATLTAEVSHRLFGPVSLTGSGSASTTIPMGGGPATGRASATGGVRIGESDGVNARIFGGVETGGGRTGATGGVVLTIPF